MRPKRDTAIATSHVTTNRPTMPKRSTSRSTVDSQCQKPPVQRLRREQAEQLDRADQQRHRDGQAVIVML